MPASDPTVVVKALELLTNWGGIILGWGLGILSTGVVDRYKSGERRKQTYKAVLAELRELRYRLLIRVYWAEAAHGRFNRELIDWMLPIVEIYSGPNPKDNVLNALREYSKGNDEEIAALARHQQSSNPPGDFWTRQEAPFSQETARGVHQFSPGFGSRLLDILAQLSEFNELCENGNYYHRLTFAPGLTQNNHSVAVGNADRTREKMVQRAKVIIKKIGVLEQAKA